MLFSYQSHALLLCAYENKEIALQNQEMYYQVNISTRKLSIHQHSATRNTLSFTQQHPAFKQGKELVTPDPCNQAPTKAVVGGKKHEE